ncbi:HAD family hydrolase [Lentzea albida]|uniref:FMN phosphatase YigB, HAD superfamily n=1 Tax=Lentzea albida TaxID=65499 RepID=A0A1H9SAN6_9PSEU|nr:HAD family hydrolase [Lentzea albida]SER82011.1 FMN phosphatase YigB, HAD superfamily [Lentzea albida]
MVPPVVIIDLDDCLIPDGTAARAAIAAVLDELSITADEQAVDTVLAAARREWRENRQITHREVERVASWEALWADFHDLPMPPEVVDALVGNDVRAWRLALDDLGSSADAQVAALAFRRLRRALVVPFPGVEQALESLGERHELWLATDGCRSLQRAKIALSGLADRFARVFVSGEVGHPKGTAGFTDAVRAALTDGRTVCFVAGDSETTDLLLAKTGGWPFVRITDEVRFAGAAAFCRCP